jgi:predicted metal-dependent phosphoesterase TrpH
MMQSSRADLHIHTCLSPCGELEMTPPAIAKTAAEWGLDIIGVCDHNAAANVPAAVQAAATRSVVVIPGLEITTREEVHVLGLFETPEVALDMERLVHRHLEGENDAEVFGPQVIVDEQGEPVGLCPHLLIGATDLSIGAVVEAIHEHGGCALAAHVDRERFSIVAQLGFVPPDLDLDGLEHSPRTDRAEACSQFGGEGRWELVCGSDAHRLHEIGLGSTWLVLDAPTAGEIRRALRHEGGRGVAQWRN